MYDRGVKKTSVEYRISRLSDLNSKVINHFAEYPLTGIKLNNYLIWCQMVNILNSKTHLTEEGLAKLKALNFLLNK